MKFRLLSSEVKIREFSQCTVMLMVILWFAGALYGGIIVWRSGYGLESLLSYIDTPMSVGILGYMLKAGFENREKIKKSAGNLQKQEEHP